VDRLLPWLRRSGWAYVLAAVALALVAWRLGPGAGGGGGQPSPQAAGPGVSTASVVDAPEAKALVHVAGEVRRPGVYRVGAGARAIEAIRRAGGPTRRADLSALNLAAPLQDGQQVLIPARAARGGGGAASAPAAAGGAVISLSSATEEELDALDGIGPTLAARIVEWRRAHGGFASVDQLLDVPGIGPARLEAVRARVTP
jgi:competence protein ComEA